VISRLFSVWAEALCLPISAVRQHGGLLQMLMQRELSMRTSGTALGRLWPLLQPALQVLGFWFMFAVVYDMRNLRGPDFLQYLLLGMLPWLCVSEVLARATNMFREFSALYARSPFPLQILPVLILLLPGLIFGIVFMLTTGWLLGVMAAVKALLLIPVLLLWLLPWVLLCAVVGLFVRDFGQALPFLLTLLMYLTPILYFPDMLPVDMRQYLWLNPMADWMAVIHTWLTAQPVPLDSLWRLLGLWLLLLTPSWLWFRRTLVHARELL
jgi:lipopolysaccharide transport system permease protein